MVRLYISDWSLNKGQITKQRTPDGYYIVYAKATTALQNRLSLIV